MPIRRDTLSLYVIKGLLSKGEEERVAAISRKIKKGRQCGPRFIAGINARIGFLYLTPLQTVSVKECLEKEKPPGSGRFSHAVAGAVS